MSIDEQPAPPAPHVEIHRGAPTEEELAAVLTVVREAYEQEASGILASTRRRTSAWQISARGLRAPLRRDLGWLHNAP